IGQGTNCLGRREREGGVGRRGRGGRGGGGIRKAEDAKFVLLLPFISSLLADIIDDNSVIGDPEIECGPSSIIVNWRTHRPFDGVVFVKGLRSRTECINTSRGREVAGIDIPFDSCGLTRSRSLNPRGIFVAATVVLSFHPLFVTMIDRSYRVQCFYMESDRQVNARVGVDELSTILVTSTPSLPTCKYEILDGSITGPPVSSASIGQKVYHKWSCSTDAVDTYCITVHSCVVNDGMGQKVMIVDEEGCAMDERLIPHLEYSNDLVAGQISHVFKYADKEELFYECHISISIKEVAAECPRPVCNAPLLPPSSSPSPPSIPPFESSLNPFLSVDSFPSTTPYRRRARSIPHYEVDVTAQLTASNAKIKESIRGVLPSVCITPILLFTLIPFSLISILVVITLSFILFLKRTSEKSMRT
ncbi:hypothetical protein PENTCL1PPCAC_6457, partial [Pristionchus entomophagus]